MVQDNLVCCFIPGDDNLFPVSLQVHRLSNLFLVVQIDPRSCSVKKLASLNVSPVGMQEMQTPIAPWSVSLACYIVTHHLVTLNTF